MFNLFLESKNKLADSFKPANFDIYLFECTHSQCVNLSFVQVAPFATSQILLCQSGKVYAVQFNYVISQRFKYTTNDTVASRVNLNSYLALIVFACITDSIGVDFAIFQFHSVSNLLHI